MKRMAAVLVLACTPALAFAQAKGPAWQACQDRHIEMFERHAKANNDHDKAVAALEEKGDKTEVCKYELANYFPMYQKMIAEQESRKGEVCWNKVNVDTLRKHKAFHRRYKSAISDDCREGGMETAQTKSWKIK